MSKILFFSYGDSNNPAVWSNVPYCFAKALEQHGHTVIRVNLKPPRWGSVIWNQTMYRLLRYMNNDHLYGFSRTYIVSLYKRFIIWIANRRNTDIDISIFTGFDDINYFSDKPSILLCDWTLEYYIKNRLKREAYFLERCYIKRQNKIIQTATCTISLFPECKTIIEKQVRNAKVHYLSGNVLNIIDKKELDKTIVINLKMQSNLILFIGNTKYLSGAKKLLDAHEILSQKGIVVELAFIGMAAEELGIRTDKHIKCFGYLNKSIDIENNLYYSLIRKARMIVNTNEDWAGFSSMIEAMYYYTPVIVTPYSEFVNTFGESIDFGLYEDESSPSCLADKINIILHNSEYEQMCINAHHVTENYSWSNYVSRIEELVPFSNTQNM